MTDIGRATEQRTAQASDPSAGSRPGTRAERRDRASADTRARILEAARSCLLADGYANLSTRRVAEAADVPLSQIHYYFGSRQDLILAMLASENERLLARQSSMYAGDEPLWQQWDRACDFLEADLESGYVRILQEMIAAGWSDPVVATSVRELVTGWYRAAHRRRPPRRERAPGTSVGSRPEEVAALMGMPFLGAESAILLGITETDLPARSALRKVGLVLRSFDDRAGDPT